MKGFKRAGIFVLSVVFGVAATEAAYTTLGDDVADALCQADSLSCRKLTTGEIALAKESFGDKIDYTRIKLFNRSFVGVTGARVAVPNGNIYVPDRNQWRNDFSKGDVFGKSLFNHELMHVLQSQRGVPTWWEGIKCMFRSGFNYEANYAYNLSQTPRLEDMNIEQQGDVVSDRYLRKAVYEKMECGKHSSQPAADEQAVLNQTMCQALRQDITAFDAVLMQIDLPATTLLPALK